MGKQTYSARWSTRYTKRPLDNDGYHEQPRLRCHDLQMARGWVESGERAPAPLYLSSELLLNGHQPLQPVIEWTQRRLEAGLPVKEGDRMAD